MLHRPSTAVAMHLGPSNESRCDLDNDWKKSNKLFKKEVENVVNALYDRFPAVFTSYVSVDFGIIKTKEQEMLFLGTEPSYAGDDLFILCFDFKNKNNCYVETGHAFGYYGTGIKKRIKHYSEYSRKSKVVSLIDDFYDALKESFRK